MGTHGKNWGGNIGNPQIENPDYATVIYVILDCKTGLKHSIKLQNLEFRF